MFGWICKKWRSMCQRMRTDEYLQHKKPSAWHCHSSSCNDSIRRMGGDCVRCQMVQSKNICALFSGLPHFSDIVCSDFGNDYLFWLACFDRGQKTVRNRYKHAAYRNVSAYNCDCGQLRYEHHFCDHILQVFSSTSHCTSPNWLHNDWSGICYRHAHQLQILLDILQ